VLLIVLFLLPAGAFPQSGKLRLQQNLKLLFWGDFSQLWRFTTHTHTINGEKIGLLFPSEMKSTF